MRFFERVASELSKALGKHGKEPWSRHQAYGIIKEEFDEFWEAIRHDASDEELLHELSHVAAMCQRFADTSFGINRAPSESPHITSRSHHSDDTPTYEPGIDKIKEGRCPIHADYPMACTFCQFGHILECHHPMNCQEANCSHYQVNSQEEL